MPRAWRIVARTYHHNGQKCGFYWLNRDPTWYRRMLNRMYRAKTNHLVRTGRTEVLPPPKRNAGWFW